MAALMAAMAPSATAVATCRTCLTRMLPGGVDAGNGGLHLFIGGDIAVFQSQFSEQLRIGNHAGIHEDAAARALHSLDMPIMLAGDLQPLYLVLAVHSVEPGGQPELDVSGSGHLLAELAMQPSWSSKWIMVSCLAKEARYSASFTAPSAPPTT